jgi:hypothetical protein
MAFVCVVVSLGLAKVSQAQVVFGNFEDGLTDGFGTGTNSGVTANTFASPTAGAVITPGSGSDLTKVLDLTASGFNGGLSSGADLAYDFVTNGLASQFLANDILTFSWEVPPSATGSGFSQLFNIIFNAPGAGFHNVGGSGGGTFAGVTVTGTVNQNPPYNGQVNTVSINYDAYKAAISASPGFIQLEFQTNNGGGAPSDIYFDNFTLSAVPEPATIVLAGLGMAALGLIAKRRRNVA